MATVKWGWMQHVNETLEHQSKRGSWKKLFLQFTIRKDVGDINNG